MNRTHAVRIVLTLAIVAGVVLLRGYPRTALTRPPAKPPPAQVPAPPQSADGAQTRNSGITEFRDKIPPAAPPVKSAADAFLDEARLALAKDDMGALQAVAARLRREARTNSEFLKRLMTLVGDGREPSDLRGIVAIVLGSIPDPEVQSHLSQTLATTGDAHLQRDLIVALGSAKDSGEMDDIFGLGDSPWVIENAFLSVRVKTVINDEAIRIQIAGFLNNSPDTGVRWAATGALRHSIQFPDVRQAFLIAVRRRPDKEDTKTGSSVTQGDIAASLAGWAAGEDQKSPERGEVFLAVIQEGEVHEADFLRLSTDEPLRRMAMSDSEVRLLAGLLDGRDFDQRRWALSILGDKAKQADLPMREDLFASIERTVTTDPDPKIREYAAGALASFPDKDRAVDLLLGALGDEAWHVRVAAARALGRMKRQDEGVRQALRRSADQDADENVRTAAGETLELLR